MEVDGDLGTIHLSEKELRSAYAGSSDRGIRGGATYDYLHLAAAWKAKVATLYTLNTTDFQTFHRAGDPEISSP